MKLDPEKFKVDENRSNSMVVAMQYPACPINGICFYSAVGFGSVVQQCKHLKAEDDAALCLYGEGDQS